MKKAKFTARLWAWLADQAVIWVVGAAISAAGAFLMDASATSSSSFLSFMSIWTALFLLIFLFLLQFLYFGILWSGGSGQSLGMKIFKIKVVRRREDPVSIFRAGFRGTIGYWISSLIFGLGYIWAAFDANKEAWHDKLFDTWVVVVDTQH